MSNNEKGKKWFKFIGIALILLLIIGSTADERLENKNKTTKIQKTDSIEEPEEEPEIETEITGELNLEKIEDEIVATIKTNAIDGSIFGVILMQEDLSFEPESGQVTINNGEGIYKFKVKDSWNVAPMQSNAYMQFNTEEKQPKNVLDAYGEYGEKLKGSIAVENNKEGYNVILESKPIPYPSEKAVKEKYDDLFNDSIDELIEVSNGSIVRIQSAPEKDWLVVLVVVGDAWYNTPEYEKERFTELTRDIIKEIMYNTKKVDLDESIEVLYFDTYNKSVAVPYGDEYKIKR